MFFIVKVYYYTIYKDTQHENINNGIILSFKLGVNGPILVLNSCLTAV